MRKVFTLFFVLGVFLSVKGQESLFSKLTLKDTSSSVSFGVRFCFYNHDYQNKTPVILQQMHSRVTNISFPKIASIYSRGVGLETEIYKQYSSGISVWNTIGFRDLEESYYLNEFGDKNGDWGEYTGLSSYQIFGYSSINFGFDILELFEIKKRVRVIPYVSAGARAVLQRSMAGSVFINDNSNPRWETLDLHEFEKSYRADKIYFDPSLGVNINLFRLNIDLKWQRFEKDYFEHKYSASNKHKKSDVLNTLIIGIGLRL
jgi:hypothetical protein